MIVLVDNDKEKRITLLMHEVDEVDALLERLC